MKMFRYYVELKDNPSLGHPQCHFYVYAYSEQQVRDMFDGYELVAIDQTD
tara:strand:+ start:52 stop:201 length:150 start_codon:yes stop_codon:yes gene_type:complete